MLCPHGFWSAKMGLVRQLAGLLAQCCCFFFL